MPRGMRSTFSREFAAYSVMMMPGNERPDVNAGGKIIMPPSSLETLSRLNISFPMLFKLENRSKERQTHAGVLEFIAEEGKVYLPGWMMRNLVLNEGDRIAITYASLPVASYSKFKPQSCDFLEISNPKAVLEKHLRSFACLSKGDIISIDYIGREFEVQIVETKPEDAVNIIECDMNVDFEAPVGYKEPERVQPPEETPGSFGTPDIQKKLVDYYEKQTNFHSFQGKGGRIDGKKKGTKGVKVRKQLTWTRFINAECQITTGTEERYIISTQNQKPRLKKKLDQALPHLLALGKLSEQRRLKGHPLPETVAAALRHVFV